MLDGDEIVASKDDMVLMQSGKGPSAVNKSEIAQMRQRIEEELEAMRVGMSGFATGVARHAFIHARMERIGACEDRLADHIGKKAAQNLVCHLYIEAMEPELIDAGKQ